MRVRINFNLHTAILPEKESFVLPGNEPRIESLPLCGNDFWSFAAQNPRSKSAQRIYDRNAPAGS
jgi:hypothetical protein